MSMSGPGGMISGLGAAGWPGWGSPGVSGGGVVGWIGGSTGKASLLCRYNAARGTPVAS